MFNESTQCYDEIKQMIKFFKTKFKRAKWETSIKVDICVGITDIFTVFSDI
jgi:hypothetical protein